MIQRTYNNTVIPDYLSDAIENREFPGFLEDYHVLHSLIRQYKPQTFFEIGTNMGTGTKIIKNAMGDGVVFSLDLPFDQLHHSMKKGGNDLVGHHCDLKFVMLRGDSMTFDFSRYPAEGYFVDGEHDYEHPFRETTEILKLKPKIIIWHDLHCRPVQEAIDDAFIYEGGYDLFMVDGTRVAYALKK